MRLFFAVAPPEAQRREIVRCVEDLRGELPGELRGRFTPAENLHLTLAFLGELDPARLPELTTAASTLVTRTGFEVEWGGLECFPNPARARVAALGVRRSARELVELARALRAALPEALRPEEKRPLRPHLTLARFREPPPRPVLERLGSELAPFSWRSRVGSVDLMRSHLGPAGARYEVLSRVELSAP
jgi:2'-5' RNA ligase